MFLRGCLLPHVGWSDVQWSQIRFISSEPRVGGSSWRSFPDRMRLPTHSNNCTVMIFIGSTACDAAKQSQETFCYQGGKGMLLRYCPKFSICDMTVYGILGILWRAKCQIHQSGHTSTMLWPTFHNRTSRLKLCTVGVKASYPREVFWQFFHNGWEFLSTYRVFVSTLYYKILSNSDKVMPD